MKTNTVLFYELPAKYLQAGASTSDGQDILAVKFIGDSVLADVYTPRYDDDEADEENRCCPEGRIYDRGEMVGMAVFDDTYVDLSTHPEAREK